MVEKSIQYSIAHKIVKLVKVLFHKYTKPVSKTPWNSCDIHSINNQFAKLIPLFKALSQATINIIRHF